MGAVGVAGEGRGFSVASGEIPGCVKVCGHQLRDARGRTDFALLEKSAAKTPGDFLAFSGLGCKGPWKGPSGESHSLRSPTDSPTHLAGQQARLAELLGFAQPFQAALQLRSQGALGCVQGCHVGRACGGSSLLRALHGTEAAADASADLGEAPRTRRQV